MFFSSQPTPAPLSPGLPENQTASYITFKERHIRPHAYRPFRIPAPTQQKTAHDLVTRLLSLGDHIPRGTFFPSSGSRAPTVRKPSNVITRVDRPSKEEYIETSTLPKLSLRRQQTIHPKSPAAATALGRGASCSSTASTIRPAPPKPAKKLTRTPKVLPRLPSLKVTTPLPSFEIVTASPIKGSPTPSTSEDEEVATPLQGREVELPCLDREEVIVQEIEIETEVSTVPGTPLNIPPTPLDIPVDWDDLRQRWSPFKSAYSSPEEEWCEDDVAGNDASDVEPAQELPAPTHAYAAGGKVIAPAASLGELKLSNITSKDLGEYFLLEPMQLQLHMQRASALFSKEEWSSLPAPIRAQGETIQGPVIPPTPGVGPRRRGSGLILDADILRSTLILSPTAADFPMPPTTPVAPFSLNTRSSTEPLPKAVLGSTITSVPTSPVPKPQNQTARKKRHARLVSLDEAELVMRTVRFSETLDSQFDYTRFGQRKDSAVSIDSRTIQEAAVSSAKPKKQPPPPPVIIAGESFLNVLSPLTPNAPRRWTQVA